MAGVDLTINDEFINQILSSNDEVIFDWNEFDDQFLENTELNPVTHIISNELNEVQTGHGSIDLQRRQGNKENESNFYIFDEVTHTSQKFNLSKKVLTLEIKNPPANCNTIDYLEKTIHQIFKYIKKNISDKRKVGVVFNPPAFIHGAGILS